MCGVVGGMLFGSYRGLIVSRNTSIPSPAPASSAFHRATMFAVRDGVLVGARVGVFVSLFSALSLALGESPQAYAAAGAITCGAYGGAARGIRAMPPTMAFGAVVGGTAAAAVAWLRDAAGIAPEELYDISTRREKAKKEKEAEKEQQIADTVDRLIEQFEVAVNDNPSSKMLAQSASDSDPQGNSSSATTSANS